MVVSGDLTSEAVVLWIEATLSGEEQATKKMKTQKQSISSNFLRIYTNLPPIEIIYDFTKESQLIQIELQKLEENVLIRLSLVAFC